MSKFVVIILIFVSSKFAVGFNATTDDSYLSCVLDTIKQLFKEEETVHFICETCEDFIPSKLKNPYVIININKKLPTYRHIKNIIIQVESVTVLQEVAKIMESDNTVNKQFIQCLVITNNINHSDAFQILWKVLVINVILITQQNNLYVIKQANPYDDGNYCGNNTNIINTQNCSTKIILKKVKQLNGYELNVTIRGSLNNFMVDAKPPMLFISPPFYYGHPSYDLTNHYYSENNVWLVPAPIRMSPFKALVSVFTIDIWILIIGFMMFTTVFWWLVKVFSERNRYFDKFCFVFIEMVSATINASVNVIPQLTSLKILVLFYIIYIIHIQTIYTSNLIRIFTNPPYEDPIKNFEDLSNSDLPIYCGGTIKMFLKENTVHEVDLSNKILSKLMVSNDTTYIEEGVRFRNCAYVMYEEDLLLCKTDDLLLMKKMVDNRLTGKRNHPFFVRKGSFFLEVVNRVIAIGVESGILDKAREKVRFQVSKLITVNENMDDSDPVVLTMEHVYVVFVLWIVGMIISIIAFCFERANL
ncbi:hypothetical protein RN001_012970 [Aquatica leii]|uniref:Ionotropic glutamate receptor C-terminal domain-containing protein n=1 Tax=Aquatica leii TaxID=1421715 RepID=A0AAN7NVV8_9COLE|nr:hypothetical protein RN001_012970 [Aquatica leii]